MNKDCVFCKIINKEIPCYKIYENNYVIAFLDLNPIAKAHTLVIPKKHFENIFDCENKYLEEVIKAIKVIGNSYKQKLNCSGINILQASGKSAQQTVFHLHFHIIPRFDNDGYNTWPNTDYKKEDLNKILKVIKI